MQEQFSRAGFSGNEVNPKMTLLTVLQKGETEGGAWWAV